MISTLIHNSIAQVVTLNQTLGLSRFGKGDVFMVANWVWAGAQSLKAGENRGVAKTLDSLLNATIISVLGIIAAVFLPHQIYGALYAGLLPFITIAPVIKRLGVGQDLGLLLAVALGVTTGLSVTVTPQAAWALLDLTHTVRACYAVCESVQSQFSSGKEKVA